MHENDVLVPLLLNSSRSHSLFQCFHCWLWTSKRRWGKSAIYTQIPKYDYCILQDVEKSSCYLKIWGISWKVYQKNKKKCFFIDTLHLWAGSMCISFTVLQRVKKAISEKTINYPNFPRKVTLEKIFKW